MTRWTLQEREAILAAMCQRLAERKATPSVAQAGHGLTAEDKAFLKACGIAVGEEAECESASTIE